MSDYNELLNSLKAAAGSAASIAKDLAETASEKARDIAGNAGAKAKALARMAKLMHEANAQRGELDAAYAEIGRVYFESADKKNPGELYLRLFDKVMLANAAIERTETEMNELRAQLSEQGIDVDFSDVVDEARPPRSTRPRPPRRSPRATRSSSSPSTATGRTRAPSPTSRSR